MKKNKGNISVTEVFSRGYRRRPYPISPLMAGLICSLKKMLENSHHYINVVVIK